MAEFIDVMRQHQRLCRAVQAENKDKAIGWCTHCPVLSHCYMDSSFDDATLNDLSSAEREIMQWAAEHPEPKYPTWYSWLTEIGAVRREVKPDTADLLFETGLLYEIPADIAQKLGLDPKGEA